MVSVLKSVAALLVSVFLFLAGNSLQFVILGLRADAEGFATYMVGLLTAGYYLGYAIGTFQAPAFVRRVGHIRAFAAAGSMVSALVLTHAIWADPVFWLVLRFVAGLCFAVIATVIESWLNARASADVRGKVLAISAIAATSGYALGPLLTSLGSVTGFVLFVAASILMSVALVPVLVTRMGGPPIHDLGESGSDYSLKRLYRETPLGLIGTVGLGVIQGAFLGLGALFVTRAGGSVETASVFMTVGLAAGMIATYPLGYLSDIFDRRLVLLIAFAALGVGSFMTATMLDGTDGAVWSLMVAASVAGAAAMPLYAIVVAHVNDRLPEPSIVPAAATLILSFSIGSVLSGPLASTALDVFGPPGLFLLFGTVLVALASVTLLRILQRPTEDKTEEELAMATPAGEPSVFLPTPVLVPMDWSEVDDQLSFDFSAVDDDPDMSEPTGEPEPAAESR